MAKNHQENFAAGLQKAFERWDYLHEHGASDPFWPDGVNLNLTRNHILYYRAQLEKNLTLFGFPEIYDRPIPPEVDPDFMARPEEEFEAECDEPTMQM